MENNKKVSIITPCYNGEKYLNKYFEMIIAQTYRPLELIFVNDGSTDQTESIALSYTDMLKNSGIEFIYLVQQNGGQAKALNNGLAHLSGAYLAWLDSDDLLTSDSIEIRLQFLVENPEYSFVRSNGRKFDFETNEDLGRISWFGDSLGEDIFLDLILEKTFCSNGCYMLKVAALKSLYPDLKIIEFSEGQNWQILIPMAGNYKCGYIDEDLFYYAVRRDSHSHKKKTESEAIERQMGLKQILENGIQVSGRKDLNYKEIVDVKYEKVFMTIYLEYGNYKKAKEIYRHLKQKKCLNQYEKSAYIEKMHPLAFSLYSSISLVLRVLKRAIKVFLINAE